MANSVSRGWVSRYEDGDQGAGLGTAMPPFPFCNFTWDTDHSVLTSPVFDFPIRGNILDILINTEEVDTATSATMTVTLQGRIKPGGTFVTIKAFSAISNGDFDTKTPILRWDLNQSSTLGTPAATDNYTEMRIQMDPSANIASSKPIRVGIIVRQSI